jgi:hypothetical protein
MNKDNEQSPIKSNFSNSPGGRRKTNNSSLDHKTLMKLITITEKANDQDNTYKK